MPSPLNGATTMTQTRCGFCWRLTCTQTEAGPAGRGQDAAPLPNGPLLPADTLIKEPYCSECDRFYQQLITFGQGERHVPKSSLPESFAPAISQPDVATRPQP